MEDSWWRSTPCHFPIHTFKFFNFPTINTDEDTIDVRLEHLRKAVMIRLMPTEDFQIQQFFYSYKF